MNDSVSEKNKWLTDILSGLKDITGKIFHKLKEDSISIQEVYDKIMIKLSQNEEWTWLIDLFVEDSSNRIFAVFSKEGLLYRSEIFLENSEISIGDLIPLKEANEPISNSILINRQNDGETRWFMIASSNVLNRSASIDSSELFDNFIRRAKDSGKYPYLTYYHLGEVFRMGSTDWLAREDNLLLASGLFDKNNIISDCMQKAYVGDPEYWGASVSFWAIDGRMEQIADGISVPMYTDGELEEISILAEKDANCLFTALHSKRKVNQMRDELISQIKILTGGDEQLANELIKKVDESNGQIVANGLITRQAQSEEVVSEDTEKSESEEPILEQEPESSEELSTEPSGVPELEIDEEVINSIVAQMIENPKVKETFDEVSKLREAFTLLSESVSSFTTLMNTELSSLKADSRKEGDLISERLNKLELEEESKREEWMNDMPKNSKTVIKYRPRIQSSKPEQSSKLDESYEDLASRTLSNIK